MEFGKGFKVASGTLAGVTCLGIGAGLIIGESSNNTPDSVVVEAQEKLTNKQTDLDQAVASFSDCSQTVLSTIVDVEDVYSDRTSMAFSPVNLDDERNMMTANCGESAEAEAELYIGLTENLREANINLVDAEDSASWSGSEKVNAVVGGFIGGWISGWVVVAVGTSVAWNYKDRKFKKTYAST